MTFEITREIGIDMGHRVSNHGSKCANLHGHRYTIQATCRSVELQSEGAQQGMTLDFGFLKAEMMIVVDNNHDHGTTLWIEDPIVAQLVTADNLVQARELVVQQGAAVANITGWGVFTLVPFTPTAEELARFWFTRLAPRVAERSGGHAQLIKLRVWETPNCFADYRLPTEP